MKPKARVSEKKVNTVREFSDLIKNKKTILIASIKNLSASQFQEISKKLRGKAIIKVPRKNLILKSINDSENEEVKKIAGHIGKDIAILFSDSDSFELASDLIENKSPAKAKAGQEAPEDVQVSSGPTDLMPGPAMTELSSVGLQIQIDKGKISIKEPKVIVRKGQKISATAADVMNKLDIKPFSVGFIPLVAYDAKEKKLYSEINVNKEEAVKELKYLFGKSLAFAVERNYPSDKTIKFLLGKADIHVKALESLMKNAADTDVDKNNSTKTDTDDEQKMDETNGDLLDKENSERNESEANKNKELSNNQNSRNSETSQSEPKASDGKSNSNQAQEKNSGEEKQ